MANRLGEEARSWELTAASRAVSVAGAGELIVELTLGWHRPVGMVAAQVLQMGGVIRHAGNSPHGRQGTPKRATQANLPASPLPLVPAFTPHTLSRQKETPAPGQVFAG